ncbi:hypothetical protein QTJ16_001768 [Diplocarpon rosae]|uniref:Uncharacterized protein n=1 Tax=Diplocarpon rosae TaxID=946125 RepID=A0AAD9WER8_9HELO|nr:hypothetical protein QTJ16_001768 [Diplocarpon rosae]
MQVLSPPRNKTGDQKHDPAPWNREKLSGVSPADPTYVKPRTRFTNPRVARTHMARHILDFFLVGEREGGR